MTLTIDAVPFRFLALPPELRKYILHFTDLVSPLRNPILAYPRLPSVLQHLVLQRQRPHGLHPPRVRIPQLLAARRVQHRLFLQRGARGLLDGMPMLETARGTIPRVEGSAGGCTGGFSRRESFRDCPRGRQQQPQCYQRRGRSLTGTDARCHVLDAGGAAECVAPPPVFGSGVSALSDAMDACARVCLSALAGNYCNRTTSPHAPCTDPPRVLCGSITLRPSFVRLSVGIMLHFYSQTPCFNLYAQHYCSIYIALGTPELEQSFPPAINSITFRSGNP